MSHPTQTSLIFNKNSLWKVLPLSFGHAQGSSGKMTFTMCVHRSLLSKANLEFQGKAFFPSKPSQAAKEVIF